MVAHMFTTCMYTHHLYIHETLYSAHPPPPPTTTQVWQLGDGGFPVIGNRYLLQPGHVDPTFNMYDWVVGMRDGVVQGVWPVMGRGPGQ